MYCVAARSMVTRKRWSKISSETMVSNTHITQSTVHDHLTRTVHVPLFLLHSTLNNPRGSLHLVTDWMPPTPPRVPSPEDGACGGPPPLMVPGAGVAGSGPAADWSKRLRHTGLAPPGPPPVTRPAVLAPPDEEYTTQMHTPWLRQLAHAGIATTMGQCERYGHVDVPACKVHPEANPYLTAALHSLANGLVVDAQCALETSLKHHPWMLDTWIMLAHTDIVSASPDAARARLADMRREMNTAESWLVSADLELFLGEPNAAVSLLHQAVGDFPCEPALWLLLGSIWERRKQLDEAREAYGRAVASHCCEPDVRSLEAAMRRVGACRGTSWLGAS
eukprot:m.77667 g.77667  ORF g.77667 m.77667 type:complete len:335 (+) comp9155_c0_seq2:404-1408(+)